MRATVPRDQGGVAAASGSNQNGSEASNGTSATPQAQPTFQSPKEQKTSKEESSSSSSESSDSSSESDSESSSGSGVDTGKEEETMQTRGKALALKTNEMLKPAAPAATAYSFQSTQAKRPACERRNESS